MKTKALYQVRYFPSSTACSRPLGRRLLPRARAVRVVQRLRPRVDCFFTPIQVNS